MEAGYVTLDNIFKAQLASASSLRSALYISS